MHNRDFKKQGICAKFSTVIQTEFEVYIVHRKDTISNTIWNYSKRVIRI